MPNLWRPNIADALRVPEPLTCSEWADRYRVIPAKTSIDRRPTQWDTSRAPYQRGVMDAYTTPGVREITIMAASQGGKTEPMYNMMAYTADRDPGPMMYIMPEEKTARKAMKIRVVPMFEASPVLRRLMTSYTDDASSLLMRLKTCDMHIAWANSPSMLASFPVYRVFLDEVDKYAGFAGKEAPPSQLAQERLKNFVGGMAVSCSTPTTRFGPIFRQWERSNKQRYHVPCPHCGFYQALKFSQVKWPKEIRDHEEIRLRRLAWYECEQCHGRWDNDMKNAAVARGVWCPEGCRVEGGVIVGQWPDSAHYGFHFSSLVCCFPSVTLSHVAAKFLEAHNADDYAQLMNFQNSWMGEIFEEKSTEVAVDSVIELQADYAAGTVPRGAVMITAGCDVQERSLPFSIRAWGPNLESWLILTGRPDSDDINDYEQLIMKAVFRGEGGKVWQVDWMGIDSGYRTDEVYEFARKWRHRCLAVKGASEAMPVPHEARRVDKNPRTGAVIPGGFAYWRLNTGYYKDMLARLQGAQPPKWHLYRDTPRDFINEVTAEHKVIRRDTKGRASEIWVPKPGSPQNHRLDTSVYELAVADIKGVRYIQGDAEVVNRQAVTEPRARVRGLGDRPFVISHR